MEDENSNQGEKYIKESEETYNQVYEEPISVEEYLEKILNNPNLLKRGAEYLLAAIEHCGTRKTFEKGEEKTRYVFFDDPYNDGENAILGNTEVLNDFVESLRGIASGSGKTDKIEWIEGPTASGKSEFKRCLLNGLKGYSQTEEGKRYTIEMNITGDIDQKSNRSPIEGSDYNENEWYKSPVQADPLSLFPEKVKRSIIKDLSDKYDLNFNEIPDLPPFSTEAYRDLRDKHKSFEEIIDNKRIRVRNYVVDYGEGVGVITSEDQGDPPKQRLVGTWNQFALQQRSSMIKGKRDKRDFIYDGVLSQGNNVVSIIEDAMQHTDLLSPLLNVIDEKKIKIDRETYMDINTLIIIISNPDLTNKIDSQDDLGQRDPLKALKRRMDKHEFNYVVNPKLEAKLIIKEMFGLNLEGIHEENFNISKPIKRQISQEIKGKELAPRSIEAAAMYDVITRLQKPDNEDLNLIDKAIIMDDGEVVKNGKTYDRDKISVSTKHRSGIPVTYTRDIIASIMQRKMKDRSYPDVILPQDIIIMMEDNFDETPVFSSQETSSYKRKSDELFEYLIGKQEEDLISAIMEKHKPTKDQVEDYVQRVLDWIEENEDIEDEDERLRTKGFETRYLGFNDSNYLNNDKPKEKVTKFRKEVNQSISSRLYWQDDNNLNYKRIPEIQDKIENYTWEDIFDRYDNLDMNEWESPLSETQTEEVKQKAIENLVELHGYSEESAELVSNIVVDIKFEYQKNEEKDSEEEYDTIKDKFYEEYYEI